MSSFTPDGDSAVPTSTAATATASHSGASLGQDMLELSDMKQLSIEDFEEKRLYLSTTIFEKRENLRVLNDAHGPIIQRRWVNKSSSKRSKFLRGIKKDLPESRQLPNFDDTASLRNSITTPATGSVSSRHCPQINFADLRRGKTLPDFIAARARAHPDEYAWAEPDNANFGGLDMGGKPSSEQQKYCMRMWEMREAKEFGKLITVKEGNVYDFKLHDGLFVLQVQVYILSFLLLCAENLSRDAEDPSTATKATDFTTTVNSSEWPSGPSLAAHAPFGPPERLDFGAVDVLVDAQVSLEVNKLLMLHEDPGFYNKSIKAIGDDHRFQVVAETYTLPQGLESDEKLDIAANVVLLKQSYRNILYFSATQRANRRLVEAQEKGQLFDGDQNLMCTEDIVYLVHLLTVMKDFLLEEVSVAAAGNGAWHATNSGFTVLQRPTRGTGKPAPTQIIDIQPQPGCDKGKLRVYNAFLALGNENIRWHYGLQTIVAAVQDMIDNDQQKHMSETLTHMFGQLAVVVELDRQLRLFQPWVTLCNAIPLRLFKTFYQELTLLQRVKREIDSLIRKPCVTEGFARDDERLAYPPPSNVDAKNLQRVQAEGKVENFWQGLNAILGHTCFEGTEVEERMLKKTRTGEKKLFETQFIRLHQTAEFWLKRTPQAEKQAEVEQESFQVHKELDDKVGIDSGEGITSVRHDCCSLRIFPNFNQDIPKKPKAIEEKLKEKTRGTAAPEDNQEQDQPQAETIRTPIALDKKAWIIKCYVLKEAQPPGGVLFNDVLHSMVSSNFSAMRTGGVEWIFMPNDEIWAQKGNIPCHAPHGKSKKWEVKDFQNFARRLVRKYNMQAEDFEEA